MISEHAALDFSGDRFSVVYQLQGDETTALEQAKSICVEQTIEFPIDLVRSQTIRENIVGRIESLELSDELGYQAVISYAVEITGYELVQLLNVIFGNSSIKPGIKVLGMHFPDSLSNAFKGPRFGRQCLRSYLGVPSRPLLCTALKPMGLSPKQLADYAYQFALGGIDIIKDDHGLADQPYSPFRERVERITDAVKRANSETGRKCIYMPNIPGPIIQAGENAYFARQAGAGGLLVCPGLLGFDTMRNLADDDGLALPIMSHPALIGSFTASRYHGIGQYALFGQLMRLSGADAVIFPSYGGRFSFSQKECREILDGTEVKMGDIKPIFPAPAGGMTVEGVPELVKFYGEEVILLIGGNLHRESSNLVENTRRFLDLVEGI